MTNQEKASIEELRIRGMGYKKIASELNLPLNTVKTYCKRHLKTKVREIDESLKCPICGAFIVHTTHKRKKKFCSDKCRMLWWKAHPELIKRKLPYEIKCLNCFRIFQSRNPKQKYCSRCCYASARRKAGPQNE